MNRDRDGEGLGGKILESWEKGRKVELCQRETGGGWKQEVEEAADTSLGRKKHLKSILELLSQEQKLENSIMKDVHNSLSTITSCYTKDFIFSVMFIAGITSAQWRRYPEIPLTWVWERAVKYCLNRYICLHICTSQKGESFQFLSKGMDILWIWLFQEK